MSPKMELSKTSEEPVKVLIADDEPTVLSLMRSVLEERGGCTLNLARNGAEALEKPRALTPDLLITDLRMPRMSGEQLTTEALRARPDLTILITTGNATLDGAVKLMKEGVFDFITKPFLVDDFLRSVDRAVERIRAVPMSRDSLAVISSLMTALETKDPYLKDHSSRVARLSRDASGLPCDGRHRHALGHPLPSGTSEPCQREPAVGIETDHRDRIAD